MKKCELCEDEVKCCGLCSACYQYVRSAGLRGVRWIMARRSKLTLFQDRLDSIAAKERVVHIRSRRRA